MRDNTADKARIAADIAAATRDDPGRVHRMLDTLDTRQTIPAATETTPPSGGDNPTPAVAVEDRPYNPDAGRRRRARLDQVAARTRQDRARRRMAAQSRRCNRGR